MGKYRKVDPKIWNDAKFISLSDSGKLLFFFLLTHPHMTPLGAMRASIPGLSSEIKWNEKAFRKAFEEILSKGMVKADENACFVWLPNFLKYNKPESPNVVKAWAKCLDDLPECQMKNKVLQKVKALLKGLPKAFFEALPKAFAKPYLKTMPNQEQEQEQEQDTYKADILHCPYAEIIELYHDILPELPRVKTWTDKRKKMLEARWKEEKNRQNPEWWKGLFEYVRESPFLMGEKGDFQANLEWLIRPNNLIKVIEGHYHS